MGGGCFGAGFSEEFIISFRSSYALLPSELLLTLRRRQRGGEPRDERETKETKERERERERERELAMAPV